MVRKARILVPLLVVMLACLLGARYATTRNAAYSTLFRTAPHVEGLDAENAGSALMKLFTENPAKFMRTLALSSSEEVQRVADLLAFDADRRGLDDYRKQLEILAGSSLSEKERMTLDHHLEMEHLVTLGRQIIQAWLSGNRSFLEENTRDMEVNDKGLAYYHSGQRIECQFLDDGRDRQVHKVRGVMRLRPGETIVIYQIGTTPSEPFGVLHIGLVKRDGVWKMESLATDV